MRPSEQGRARKGGGLGLGWVLLPWFSPVTPNEGLNVTVLLLVVFIFALRFVCGFWRERYLKGWVRFSEGIGRALNKKIRDEEG